MVMARLHLICGNCGCNDSWEWKYIPEEVVDGEVMRDEDVLLQCNNCSTHHYVSQNAKPKEE
jgi:hypothetical protein